MNPQPGDGRAARPRTATARFRAEAGGIAAVEAFSRGDALDRDWMGWGALRVLSRQAWAPGAERDEGRVANIDRLLLVLDGVLDVDGGALGRHRVQAGDALWVACGHGVDLRLANASAGDPLRLVDAWLRPERVNATPRIAAARIVAPRIAAPHIADAGADARVTLMRAGAGETLELPKAADPSPGPGGGTLDAAPAGTRLHWLEVLEGELAVGGHGQLAAGDGLAWIAAACGAPGPVAVTGDVSAAVLLFSLRA